MILRSWKNCVRCGLHQHRRHVVIGEGDVPADLLLIGEGPGRSEDLLSRPFVGPSGQLLRRALRDAAHLGETRVPSHYITNVVACRPCSGRSLGNRPPTREECGACAPRLQIIFQEVQPRCVVLLGQVARRECGRMFPRALKLVHPAYLLRTGGTASEGYLPFIRSLGEFLGAGPEG